MNYYNTCTAKLKKVFHTKQKQETSSGKCPKTLFLLRSVHTLYTGLTEYLKHFEQANRVDVSVNYFFFLGRVKGDPTNGINADN